MTLVVTSIQAVIGLGAALSSVASGYLLFLLVAAITTSRRALPRPVTDSPYYFTVLVPAHNEEAGITHTLTRLLKLDFPHQRFRIVVVADNCEDRTAELAKHQGVLVLVRRDPSRRGKGYALDWALGQLDRGHGSKEVIVFVDADCDVSPNLLTAIDARVSRGARAVQTNNVVSNPDDSWVSALRFAAFTLINTVQPAGKDAVGLSCGLKGTGMAIRRDLLSSHSWDSLALAEDGAFHASLVEAGERVHFAREAWVRSAMPASLEDSRSQQLRWEGGRWQYVRQWTPRLLDRARRSGSGHSLLAALEPLVPPQSLLMAGNAFLLVAAALLRSRAAFRLSLVGLLGQTAFILGGLAYAGAPRNVYKALIAAPALVLWKLGLYVRVAGGGQPKVWTRSPRVYRGPTRAAGE